MYVNRFLFGLAIVAALAGCTSQKADAPLVGTWELVGATATQNDSTFSTFDPTHKMIKIISPTHFAFLNHAVDRNKDSSATGYSAGGGTYTLADSVYTEHLDYFSDKAWEGKKFAFVVKIAGDTLTQKGVEKLEELGIDRVIVETYKRVDK